jgi:AbrB family looped-hinge helix DNA binding protein
MIATSLTKNGQITITKEIRKALGLKEGDKLIFTLRDGEVMMRPLRGTIIDLRGSVSPRAKEKEE